MVLYYLFVGSVGHFGFGLFPRVYVCTVLFAPFKLVGRVAYATFRLHNYYCRAQIWSYWCLNWVDRLPLVVISLIKSVSRAAVSDVKFMKASSLEPFLIFLALPYPAAPAVCSTSSLSRYLFLLKSGHRDQISCSLLGGFSKPRTAANQSLDSGLCSMLIKVPSCPFIRTRPTPFLPTRSACSTFWFPPPPPLRVCLRFR